MAVMEKHTENVEKMYKKVSNSFFIMSTDLILFIYFSVSGV